MKEGGRRREKESMKMKGILTINVFNSWSKTVGVFWLNAAETWVDIANAAADKVCTTSAVTLPLSCDASRGGGHCVSSPELVREAAVLL